MQRRTFIKGMALATAGVYLQGCNLLSIFRDKPTMKNMAWITAKKDMTAASIREDFAMLANHGLQGVLLSGSLEDYKTAAPEAQKAKLELHAWMMVLRQSDKELIEKHPEWYNVNRNGKSSATHPQYVDYYNWLCPSRQEVRNYVTDMALKRAQIPGITSVHLDYIRFPDVILPRGLWEKYDIVQDKEYPKYDYCYCNVCRQMFKLQHGRDPLKMENPAADKDWKQYRYTVVTQTVNQIVKAVHKKDVLVTAAVFPTPDIARRLVRQDWPAWNVDAYFPMIYHNFYNKPPSWIEKATGQGVQSLDKGQKLYSGIFVPQLSPKEMAKALEYAQKGGASGVSLFTGYTPEEKHWKLWDATIKKYSG